MDEDDAHMAAAFVKAKSSLDQYLRAWRSPPSGTSDFSVKIAISDGRQTEYFWIGELREESDSFVGEVGNTP